MKRRKLQRTSLWGEESQVLSPLSFPFPGVTYFLALSLYCFLAQCPQLWSWNQPLPRRTLLCSYGCRYSGFSSREQELRYGVKELSTAAAAWEDLLFLIPAPQQELTPAKPGLLESFVSYLMTQLLTHIAQQSCQAMEAAQMPWDKIQSLHLHLPFPLWWSYVSIQLSAEQICNIIVSKQRGCLYSKQCKQCGSLHSELWKQ